MKTASHKQHEGSRPGHDADARDDYLLPWADPYIAHLAKRYRLEHEESGQAAYASIPRASDRWASVDFRAPARDRGDRLQIGWSLRRTVARVRGILPGCASC
jgi:hypothetical protein